MEALSRRRVVIKAGVGLSYLADPVKAALEASDLAMGEAGLVRADLVLFFCTYAHATQLQEIISQIEKVTAAKEIAGCTGYGIIAGSQEVEQATGLSVMVISSDTIKGKSFLVKAAPKNETLTAQKIVQESGSGGGPDNIGILFPDFSQTHPELLLNALRKIVPEASWVGGCPSANNNSQATYQAARGQAATKSVCGMYLSGSFHTVLGVAQSAIPVGKTYTITEAKENVIHKLDGKNAYDSLAALAKATAIPPSQDPNAWIFMAFSPADGKEAIGREEYFVRNILGVDPQRGIIAVAAHVHEGQKVSFALRDGKMAREDLRNLLRRIKRDLPGPVRLGLYFNCCARGRSLYQSSGVDTSIIEEELGKFPLAGFFTYGELGPVLGQSLLHNYSGVLFLVCD